jgi:branched-chain amino acid transport system ATP-binding protein
MLEVSGLSKNFGSLAVARDINLVMKKGERRAILGPNGAGKTTLFNMLSGEVTPSAGKILINGKDVTRLSPDARARAGLGRSFQRNNLFADLTVRENLVIACTVARNLCWVFWKPLSGLAGVRADAEQLALSVRLENALHVMVRHLSYGSQRQLEVALALACKPSLLLLDEPTAGMSPEETLAMKRLVGGLSRELAVLLIEHDMDVVFDLADRITVLNYGQVVDEGTPDHIRKSSVVREIYLGESQHE